MKIILSGDDLMPAMEAFRAEHDPDNSASLKDIIENPRFNYILSIELMHLINSILFTKPHLRHMVRHLTRRRFISKEDSAVFINNLNDITVLGESCDIVLTFL